MLLCVCVCRCESETHPGRRFNFKLKLTGRGLRVGGLRVRDSIDVTGRLSDSDGVGWHHDSDSDSKSEPEAAGTFKLQRLGGETRIFMLRLQVSSWHLDNAVRSVYVYAVARENVPRWTIKRVAFHYDIGGHCVGGVDRSARAWIAGRNASHIIVPDDL